MLNFCRGITLTAENVHNISILDIIWFSLTTTELFFSLTLNKFIRGVFRSLLNVERFVNIVNIWNPLTIFTKSSILNVSLDSKFSSVYCNMSF